MNRLLLNLQNNNKVKFLCILEGTNIIYVTCIKRGCIEACRQLRVGHQEGKVYLPGFQRQLLNLDVQIPKSPKMLKNNFKRYL